MSLEKTLRIIPHARLSRKCFLDENFHDVDLAVPHDRKRRFVPLAADVSAQILHDLDGDVGEPRAEQERVADDAYRCAEPADLDLLDRLALIGRAPVAAVEVRVDPVRKAERSDRRLVEDVALRDDDVPLGVLDESVDEPVADRPLDAVGDRELPPFQRREVSADRPSPEARPSATGGKGVGNRRVRRGIPTASRGSGTASLRALRC